MPRPDNRPYVGTVKATGKEVHLLTSENYTACKREVLQGEWYKFTTDTPTCQRCVKHRNKGRAVLRAEYRPQ